LENLNIMDISRRNFIGRAGTAVACMYLTNTLRAESYTSIGHEHPVCLFSKHLQFLGIEDLACIISIIGFDGIDLTVRKGGHIEPENVKHELPKAVKIAQKYGLNIPMITTRITGIDLKTDRKIIEVAADNGITHYRMGSIDYDHSMSISKNIQLQKYRFEALNKINKKYKIHGGFQNHWGSKFGSPVWDLYQVLEELRSEWTGSQYDIRHAVVEGGGSWILGMKAIAPYITSVVIKDFVWIEENGNWYPRSVPLGTGMVDFELFFREFRKLEKVGPLSLHYEYDIGLGKNLGEKIPGNNEIIEFYKKDLNKLRLMLAKASINIR